MKRTILCVLLALFGMASVVSGQVATATIFGTVKDSTGAVVPGAKITATNVDTQQSAVTTSGTDGSYRFTSIPVGNYTLKTEMNGFKTALAQKFTLTVAQQMQLDVNLQVGAAVEQVQVTTEEAQVDTTTSTIGSTVNEQQVANLPLNGRNYIQLALLQSGINEQKNRNETATANLASQGTFYSSNGAPTRSNQYLIDGTSTVEYGGATASSISGSTLGIDGIREFKVLSDNFDAQYGMTMGSQMLVISRSGTNQFHGDAFDFLRNSAMDARNYFDTAASAGLTAAGAQRRLPPFRRNNFGGSVGGPIRKDKTFFDGVYEAIRQVQGLTELTNTLPTGCRGAAGTQITPAQCSFLTSTVTVSPYTAPWTSTTGPNGLPPIFPAPNYGTDQESWSYGATTQEDFGQARVDQTFSSRDSMFGRYTIDNALVSLPESQPGFADNPTSRLQVATIAETHIFSANTLNTASLGYNRSNLWIGGPVYYNGAPYSYLPSGPADQTGSNGYEMGGLTISSPVSITNTAGGQVISQGEQSIYSLRDDMYTNHGKNEFKYGTLINYFQMKVVNGISTTGALSFLSVNNFLQGIASSAGAYFTSGFDNRKDIRYWTMGFYVQDDMKLSHHLTMNLGFRYEPNTNMIVLHDKGASIANTWVDAAPTTGDLMMEDPSWHNFSPRLGVAWDPLGNGKLAIRGGVGYLQNVATWIGFVHVATKQLPEENAVTIVAASSGNNVGLTISPSCTSYTSCLTIPFPNVTPALTARTPTFYHYGADGQQPRGLQYNFSVQRQFAFSTVLTAAYTGARYLGLLTLTEGNPTLPTGVPGTDSNGYETCVKNTGAQLPLAQQVYKDGIANTCFWQNPNANASTPADSFVNQNWGYMTELQGTGQSWYNSAQLTFNKAVSHGLQFQTAFTWSKLLDTTQSQSASDTGSGTSTNQLDPLHPERDRGPATFDLPLTFRFNAVYSLPTVQQGGFVGAFANGWQVLPILQMQSGSDFDLGMSTVRSIPIAAGSGTPDRPDVYPNRSWYSITHGTTAGCNGVAAGQKLGTQALYYDPCAFYPAPRGFEGDMGRDSLRGPNFSTLDLSLLKDTRAPWMGEAGAVEFRFETFNVLNRANFGTPSRTVYPGSGTGSTYDNDVNETVSAHAGQITSTLSTSRQLQLALKLIF